MHKTFRATGPGHLWRWIAGVCAALLVLAGGFISDGASARIQKAPASRIALDLPDGYEPAKLFAGFIHERLGVSLVIVEMPGRAYEELAKGLTPAALAAKGVTVVRQAKLARPDEHIFIEGEQVSPAGAFAKYLVVFRDGDVTALITANVQKAAPDKGGPPPAEIEAILASARIEPTAAAAKDLFTLRYLGPFQPAGAFLGNARTFTLDGRPPPVGSPATQPVLIVAPSLDKRTVPNPGDYAEKLLLGLGGLKDVKVVERDNVTYGGVGGIEIEAEAREKDSGAPVMLYQVVLLPRDGGYWRILAQAPRGDRDRFLSEFRRIASGFALLP